MPLKSGSSEEVLKYNIEELMQHGYSQEQAVAIAMEQQKKYKERHKEK